MEGRKGIREISIRKVEIREIMRQEHITGCVLLFCFQEVADFGDERVWTSGHRQGERRRRLCQGGPDPVWKTVCRGYGTYVGIPGLERPGTPCSVPQRACGLWLWAVHHAECPAVQREILCLRYGAAGINEGQDRQWQLLSPDHGGAGTGDPAPQSGEAAGGRPCGRSPPVRLRQGEAGVLPLSATGPPAVVLSVWRWEIPVMDPGREAIPPLRCTRSLWTGSHLSCWPISGAGR